MKTVEVVEQHYTLIFLCVGFLVVFQHFQLDINILRANRGLLPMIDDAFIFLACCLDCLAPAVMSFSNPTKTSAS